VICNPENKDFAKFQLQEVMNSYRTQYTLLVQILTALVIADVSVIGYALHEKTCGIIFAGAIFPIMMMFIKYRVRKIITPILYSGLSIESKYGSPQEDWIVSTYLNFNYGSRYVKTLLEVSKLPSQDMRIQRLKAVQKHYNSVKQPVNLILYGIAIAQIISTLVLHYLFGVAYFG
jgi:hypothetical protein